MRKIVLFKIDNEVVVEENGDFTLYQIEKMKDVISFECDVNIDDIEVVIEELPNILSEIDVSVDGMFIWTDVFPKPITGITLSIEIGGDEYLEAITKGNLIDYIIFK